MKKAKLWLTKRKADLSLQEQNFIKASSRRRIQFAMSMIVLFFMLIAIMGIAGWFYLTRLPDPTRVTTLQDNVNGSLRYCIDNAPLGSTITFTQGLRGTIWLSGTLIVEDSKRLTLRGPGADQITISGGNSNAHIQVSKGTTLNISDLSFKNSQTVDNAFLINEGTLTVIKSIISDNKTISGTTSYGGGIDNWPTGTLTVNNSTFSNNSVGGEQNGQGGGVENDGTLTVSNSTFLNNSASGEQNGQGGGIANVGTLTVTQSTFSANSTSGKQDGIGGGIVSTGTLTVSNSIFSRNSASGDRNGEGGGIENADQEMQGKLTVSNSTFSNNSASGKQFAFGGGISNYRTGTLKVSNSTFSNNSASGEQGGTGGGIHNAGRLAVSNSTFSHNSASGSRGLSGAMGGGIENTETGTLMVSNSTFLGNTASGDRNGQGGGVENDGTLTVTYSTFLNNAANGSSSFGGGIVDYSNAGSDHLMISRSIIAANSAHDGPDIYTLGVLISAGYNLSDNFAEAKGLNATTDKQVPLADLKIDPTLRNNGGPTQTLALLPGSPAIDAIPNEICRTSIMDVSDHTVMIITDQRGEPRPDGSENACDIGAYESSY